MLTPLRSTILFSHQIKDVRPDPERAEGEVEGPASQSEELHRAKRDLSEGQGFSPAVNERKQRTALAAEGMPPPTDP